MSWEKMKTCSIPCPCGKGQISRTDYMDDWNRSKSSYSIDCAECREKYRIVSKSYYKHPGDSGEIYYLLKKNYPKYDGTKLVDIFPAPVDINKISFDEYLMKSFTSEELQNVMSELKAVTAVSRLTGKAALIAKLHKKAFRTAKLSTIRTHVESALNKYNDTLDNKDRRLPIEQKEREERFAYDEEMQRHMICISL